MAKVKVKRDFIELSPLEKYAFGSDRHANMVGNVNFTTPTPTMIAIAALNDDLFTKWTDYQNGGIGTKEYFEAALLAWNEGFSDLADYVDDIADGNASIIASGGWSLTDVAPSKRPVAGGISNLKATYSPQAGTIKITSDPADFADSYITFVSSIADIASQIQIMGEQFVVPVLAFPLIVRPSKRTSVDITNLTSGTRYYIYRFARNSTGRGPDSQVVNIIAP